MQAPAVQLVGPAPVQYPQPYVVPVYIQGVHTNSYAVASFVIGILSWFFCPIVGAIVAVVLGHTARGQIRRTGEGGSGFAVAGLVLGYAHLAVVGLVILFWIVLFGGMAAMIGLIGTLPTASPSP